ncbi:MAG: galactokinase, partial [Saprospiraceae bacterium]|nr:galactokinase [Saprospiraceae bacterium]
MSFFTFWKNHPFFKNFEPELLVKAPGRINLIGEHTDYHLGWVLPAAIDQSIWFAFRKMDGQQAFSVHSLFKNETKVLSLFENSKEGNWSDYLENILELCRNQNLPLDPMEVLIGGDLPVGAGVSSSSALTCGFLAGLNELMHWQLSNDEMIKMASAAEYQLGLEGGLMDQTAIFYGKKGKFILIDNQKRSLTYTYGLPEDYALILLDSGVEHALVNSEYNLRRKESEAVLPFLKNDHKEVKSLRDINAEMLDGYKTILPPIPFQRAIYVLEENQRVLESVEAIKNGNIEKIGALMYASHQGLSQEYEVSCEELDLLVSLAQKQKGVIGARMMGGGFGGCTINLVDKKEAEKIIQDISRAYFEATGIETKAHVVQPSDGITTFALDQTKYQ